METTRTQVPVICSPPRGQGSQKHHTLRRPYLAAAPGPGHGRPAQAGQGDLASQKLLPRLDLLQELQVQACSWRPPPTGPSTRGGVSSVGSSGASSQQALRLPLARAPELVLTLPCPQMSAPPETGGRRDPPEGVPAQGGPPSQALNTVPA